MDKITKPARIGSTIFQPGVKASTVLDRAYREYEHHSKYPNAPKQHCQNGSADICLAGSYSGVTCPPDSCDIDDRMRDLPIRMAVDPASGPDRSAVAVCAGGRTQGKTEQLKRWVAEMREKHPGIQIFFRPGPDAGFEEVKDD